MTDSELISKGPCSDCGSSDACALYTDGHTFCFSCSAHHRGDGEASTTRRPKVAGDFKPYSGECEALPKRGITVETCQHFGYLVGTAWNAELRRAEKAHIAPYYKDGVLVAQHTRGANKVFAWAGEPKGCELFGQHLWRDGGKKVVVTEGEIDAMSVSQLQGNKWPVVSIPSGAQGAKKALQSNLEWLEKFDEVVLMFDMDEPGKEAVAECAPLFTPGRCKVASLPLKDANEMLKAGRGGEVIEAMWGAKPYRPDGVVKASDLVAAANEDITVGYPWFLPTLTELTHGRRDGELYGLGAGTGVGKTDVFTQSIAYDLDVLKQKVGMLYLEQATVESVRRVAGKMVGKVLHVPGRVTPEERAEALHRLDAAELYLYDSFGINEWDTIKARLRYMVVGLGVKMVYLDHLTALVAGEEDENGALKAIMGELAGFAKETGCIIHFISHLATPDGKPHEEGGRVMIRHFRGSRTIGFWAHFLFGLERDQQAEDPADQGTTFRVLKDRNTGQATGKTIQLQYDPSTGLLSEGESSPFVNHSATGGEQEF